MMYLRYDIPEFPSPGTPNRSDAVCQGWWTEKTTPSDSCRFNIEQHKFGKIKCRKLGKIVCRISGKINAFFSGKVLAVYTFLLYKRLYCLVWHTYSKYCVQHHKPLLTERINYIIRIIPWFFNCSKTIYFFQSFSCFIKNE